MDYIIAIKYMKTWKFIIIIHNIYVSQRIGAFPRISTFLGNLAINILENLHDVLSFIGTITLVN